MYNIDSHQGKLVEEAQAPGKPVSATMVGDEIFFVLSEEGDSRFIRRFVPGHGFKMKESIACPEDTGSFLSFDGKNLWLGQRYHKRLLQLDAQGKPIRTIEVGAEIIGSAFVGERLYLSTWHGAKDGGCQIAYVVPASPKAEPVYVARSPFAAVSLARDGDRLWTNDFKANEIVAFSLNA